MPATETTPQSIGVVITTYNSPAWLEKVLVLAIVEYPFWQYATGR